MPPDNASNMLQLAKQGDPKAIASLINRQLQPKGITAKASLKDGCLQIILESASVPKQQVLVAAIGKWINSLGADSIQKVKVYGKKTGDEFPDWVEEFKVIQNPKQSLEDLAKQGDIKAIALLIKQQLEPKGVLARINIKDDCLQIMLESSEAPDQEQIVPFLKTKVLNLEIQSISKMKIYGRKTDEEFPDWHTEVSLLTIEEPISSSLLTKIDGIALSNELYTKLEGTCYHHLAYRMSSEDDKSIHELAEHFVDDLEADLKFDLGQFARLAVDSLKTFGIQLEVSRIQSLVADVEILKFSRTKLAIRDLEKMTQKILQIDFPPDSDEITAFFRGASNEIAAQFSGRTTLSHEAFIGATIGSFFTPVIGTMVGGVIGNWLGGEREQKELENVLEKYEEARRKFFVEWELLLQVLYDRLINLIANEAHIELLTFEAIDQANNFLIKGNEFLEAEELTKSIESYDSAINLNPRLNFAWNNKGYVLNKLERYEDAIIVLEQAIKLDNTFDGAFYNYGEALSGLGRDEEAISAYEKSIELDPESYEAWWSMGFCFIELDRTELALQSFERLIEINKEHPFTWLVFCFRARCYINLNDLNQAIENLTEASIINPSEFQEFISGNETFDRLKEDARFKELTKLGTINCPSCDNSNPVAKYTTSINCNSCGIHINVAARQNEVRLVSANSSSCFEKVQVIVAAQLGVEVSEVKPEASFANDLGADSLDTVELVMALEEEFGVEIPDEDAEGIATVQNAVDYIERAIK